ncbi:calcium-binding protein [Streptomyces olivaceiscleroticus]|uniref:Calcium-binding protein n=1 Tax=Streptomyces olivaceiscleroticus TaxID=68245 RepID=A0ABP3JU68_9ACTN
MRKHGLLAATAAAGLAFGAVVLVAPAAQADATPATGRATVVHDEGVLRYQAADGQRNDLAVTVEGIDVDPSEFGGDYLITFRDPAGMAVDASAAEWDACTYPTAADHTVVQCIVPEPLGSDDSTNYEVYLGDGDDRATITSDTGAIAAIHGGAGADVLKGTGQNQYDGGDGNDRIDGSDGLGADGGAGNDTITGACQYVCRGGAGDDSVTGTGDINALYGDDGNDILHAGSDNDEVYGGRGNDKLYGEDGNDTMYGNSGDDVLYGGRGKDTLSGGPGNNKVYQD